MVILDRSSGAWATRGLIQVLNCCSGSSWASCSIHACQRLCPAFGDALSVAVVRFHTNILGLFSVDSQLRTAGWILVCQTVIHNLKGASPCPRMRAGPSLAKTLKMCLYLSQS